MKETWTIRVMKLKVGKRNCDANPEYKPRVVSVSFMSSLSSFLLFFLNSNYVPFSLRAFILPSTTQATSLFESQFATTAVV